MDKAEKEAVIVRELRSLGQFYRNDWSDFDGRMLRNQLDTFCDWVEADDDTYFTMFSDMLKEQEEKNELD